jgi:protein-L-isoaspartate(D-aspartate) O-methyltransferase
MLKGAFLRRSIAVSLAAFGITALVVLVRYLSPNEPGTISAAVSVPADEYVKRRLRMVETQIAARGVRDKNVLAAMRKVRRHEFVPPSLRSEAYSDWPLPIGYGQTISQPYIVAVMTELLQPKSASRILEIGTGSGYQAAVLAEIVKEVWTIEIVEALGRRAKKVLADKYPNKVKAKIGDGYHGWKEGAPYDGIIVTCAANNIPPPLLRQLKEGGRMVIPVKGAFYTQNLLLVEKKKGGKIITRTIFGVRFVDMTGAIQKKPRQ